MQGPNAYRARLSPDLSFLNLAANQVRPLVELYGGCAMVVLKVS
jgi:hypothetical protein